MPVLPLSAGAETVPQIRRLMGLAVAAAMNDDFAGLNLVELLDLLEPVPEPVPPSLWPETVGWVWLGVALVLLLAWLAYRWHRAYRANAYRRAALDAIAVGRRTIRQRSRRSSGERRSLPIPAPSWRSCMARAGSRSSIGAMAARASRPGRGGPSPQAPYQPSPRVPELGSVVAEWVRRHSTATASR